MPDLSDSLQGIGSRDQLVHTMAYAIRCPEIAPIAVERLSPLDFDEATQADFMVVWHVARMYWKEYSAVPPVHYLSSMSVAVMSQRGYQEPVYHDGVRRLVASIYSIQEQPWNVRLGRQLLNALFNDIFRNYLKTTATEEVSSRDQVLDRLGERRRQLTVNDMPVVQPFDLATAPEMPKRMPTGVTFVDILLGGGLIRSDLIGILGPTGGGKTLLAIQLSCSLAERKQHVDYFTYEQPADDLRPRVISCATKISRITLEQTHMHDMKQRDREQIQQTSARCREYLRLIDRSHEGHSVSEIASYIHQRIAVGEAPKLVVIDWMWPLISRMTGRSERKDVQERKLLMQVTEQFKSIAAETGVCFLLLHQLSTEIAKKSPGRKPQWFNSAEAGAFAWFLPYCFAIGTADAHGYCWLVGSKSRNAARKEVIVRLDGEHNRFQATDKAMTYDIMAREFVADDDVGRMPGVKSSADISDEEVDFAGGLGKVNP